MSKNMRLARAILIASSFAISPASADPDNLLPMMMASIQNDLQKELTKLSIRDRVEPIGCLDGSGTRRTVCSLKIGRILSIMAETKPGQKDVVGVTMISSGTEGPADVAKCLLAYNALIGATTSGLNRDVRGKIISTLTSALDVGNEMSIQTDERKYVLQRSIGLWFHVSAAGGED